MPFRRASLRPCLLGPCVLSFSRPPLCPGLLALGNGPFLGRSPLAAADLGTFPRQLVNSALWPRFSVWRSGNAMCGANAPPSEN